MEELKKYLNYQIEHLEKWDENKTLSEYGKGKLSALKDVLEQLTIPVVVQAKPEKSDWMTPEERAEYNMAIRMGFDCK